MPPLSSTDFGEVFDLRSRVEKSKVVAAHWTSAPVDAMEAFRA